MRKPRAMLGAFSLRSPTLKNSGTVLTPRPPRHSPDNQRCISQRKTIGPPKPALGQKWRRRPHRQPAWQSAGCTSRSGPGWRSAKLLRVVQTAGVISALIRCTVPVPTPSVVAILRIPTSPFLSALRIAASVAVLMVGRPSNCPAFRSALSLISQARRSASTFCGITSPCHGLDWRPP
jgi:hypothetical protein